MNQKTCIEGTPPEIGAAIFTKFCAPAVREAATTMQATPQQLAALYTGFISACLGSMGADFGQERAAQIAQIVTDNIKTMDFGREATKH